MKAREMGRWKCGGGTRCMLYTYVNTSSRAVYVWGLSIPVDGPGKLMGASQSNAEAPLTELSVVDCRLYLADDRPRRRSSPRRHSSHVDHRAGHAPHCVAPFAPRHSKLLPSLPRLTEHDHSPPRSRSEDPTHPPHRFGRFMSSRPPRLVTPMRASRPQSVACALASVPSGSRTRTSE